jgi:hypothetical protein
MYAALVEGGVDDLMAKHVAHLFIRERTSSLNTGYLSSSLKPIIRKKFNFLKG